MNILSTITQFTRQHSLLESNALHITAVSGGADSVCLLLCMMELGYRVHAAHCNFMLRGDESLRDEQFVSDLCLRLGVPLSIAHFDTREYAALHKVSIEMAARQLRYAYFEQLRRDLGAATICVAHHSDDQAETVLMNLLRGTGIEGMTGMKPRNGNIVRPLLCLSRNDIEQWLKERGQTWVTDSTNMVADVLRNKLRLQAIPLLEQIYPGATQNIVRSAQWAAEAFAVYRKNMAETIARIVSDGSVRLDALMAEPSAESILFEWLQPYGFTPATIAAIRLDALEQGRQWLSATHRLTFHQGALVLTPIRPERPTLRIPETGRYIYDDTTTFTIKVVDDATVSRDANVATLDADKVKMPLTIRPVMEGDRFHPFGMRGTKLVSDYLTDRKMSIDEKLQQLAVNDAQGRIIWLVGQRSDQRFCVDRSTKRTMVLSELPNS